MATEFVTKAEILSDLWLNYRNEDSLIDFFQYNDLGLPLAYALTFDLVTLKDNGKAMVEEAFDLLLAALGIEEDEGYQNIDELLSDLL